MSSDSSSNHKEPRRETFQVKDVGFNVVDGKLQAINPQAHAAFFKFIMSEIRSPDQLMSRIQSPDRPAPDSIIDKPSALTSK